MRQGRNLRYSPFNWLVVDWGFNGRAFDDCGLPQPQPCEDDPEQQPAPCRSLPIQEAIDTYGWDRWLPEIIVGIEDPDEEIAANYVRQAAIEFCKQGRILQREVTIELQPGEDTYPVFPFEEEQIIGVIAARVDGGSSCSVMNHCCGEAEGIYWELDTARNQVQVRAPRHGLLRLLVWAAPTEDACVHDVFIYDRFRADISGGARNMYVGALHFRDRALIRSLTAPETFRRAMLSAKTKAVRKPTLRRQQSGSGMWG